MYYRYCAMESIKDNLRCSITGFIFFNPVTLESGQTYEKRAIQKWLRTNNTCPITRRQITNKTLQTNVLVKQIVEKYLLKFPNEKEEQYNENNCKEPFDANTLKEMIGICYDVDNLDIFEYLDGCENLNVGDCNNTCAIHIACRYGNKNIINYLIKKGVNLECETIHGARPIHFACESNRKENIMCLVNKNVNLECENINKWRPIHVVCKNGHLECLKYLIGLGVNLECESTTQRRPLHIICQYGSFERIKCLTDAGANLECETNEKWRPIHIMCYYQTKNVILFYFSKCDTTVNCLIFDGKPVNYTCFDLIRMNKLIDNADEFIELLQRQSIETL